METPAQRCLRLVAALEDLVHQESATLAKGDWSGAAAVQERSGPLVDFLSNDTAAKNDPALRARLAGIHQRRDESSRALQQKIEETRSDLQQTHAAKRRVAQVAPAYGASPSPRHRLQAKG